VGRYTAAASPSRAAPAASRRDERRLQARPGDAVRECGAGRRAPSCLHENQLSPALAGVQGRHSGEPNRASAAAAGNAAAGAAA